MNKSQKILTSSEEIKTFCGNISDYTFKKYIKMGMPARFEGGSWWAHADNIEEWFKNYTRVCMRNAIDEPIDSKNDYPLNPVKKKHL